MNHTPAIRIGLPRSIMNELAEEAMCLRAPVMVSLGGIFDAKKDSFIRLGMVPWLMDAALDSAGFTAMSQGGYRWTVAEHVHYIATNGDPWTPISKDVPRPWELPFPWSWWAAMDYCCENQIAPNRAEVERRMKLTIETYVKTLLTVSQYWNEGWGLDELPRPMPTLQGRTPKDYLWSAAALSEVWQDRPLTEVEEEDGRDDSLFPSLIGVGSVCGREVLGKEGIIPVLDALHHTLPPTVKLHLFGAKGDVLAYLHMFPGRVQSIDSMAWDTAAMYSAGKVRKERGIYDKHDPDFFSCDMEHRRRHMRRWYLTQKEKLQQRAGFQTSLFGGDTNGYGKDSFHLAQKA